MASIGFCPLAKPGGLNRHRRAECEGGGSPVLHGSAADGRMGTPSYEPSAARLAREDGLALAGKGGGRPSFIAI